MPRTRWWNLKIVAQEVLGETRRKGQSSGMIKFKQILKLRGFVLKLGKILEKGQFGKGITVLKRRLRKQAISKTKFKA